MKPKAFLSYRHNLQAEIAKEVWLCDQEGKISYFSADGKIASSEQV